MNINPRIQLYKYYKNILKTHNKNSLFSKEKILGEGVQGKVYQYCEKKESKCLAVKKMYLDKKESKYVKNMYDIDALKHAPFIELASNMLINELVLQRISPNFVLTYSYYFEKRSGVCQDTHPYKGYFYNEFISDSETFTEWITKPHSIEMWYNAFFQIISAIYVLQKYFNMTHLDLHSDNIFVKKIQKGGFWIYQIHGKKYKVPNLGYHFYISDFGYTWVPNKMKSWVISKIYMKSQIHKGFDLEHLYKSTSQLKIAPKEIRNNVKISIKRMRLSDDSEEYAEIINEIWGKKYINNKNTDTEKHDIYNMDKKLDIKDIPSKLKDVVKLN